MQSIINFLKIILQLIPVIINVLQEIKELDKDEKSQKTNEQ